MSDPSYPVARAVSERIQSHFQQLTKTKSRKPASVPDPAAIQAIIEAGFWASLRREEGYVPKISLAFVAPSQLDHPLTFEEPLALDPIVLTKVAAAVERPGIHLAVWRNATGFEVWGVAQTLPSFCFVLEVVGPGLLAIKQSDGPSGKFANVAVLEGNQVKIVDQNAAILRGAPLDLASLAGVGPAVSGFEENGVLLQLAISMRQHGRGGSLLVTRAGMDTWKESILRPLRYSVTPPFAQLAQLSLRRADSEIRRSVDAIAGLTAVDGATIIDDRYDLLAFGAKIVRREGFALVERVVLTEAVEGTQAGTIHPAQLGGTRHLAAAQFVHDQRDDIAMVASQDGRFTVFAWSPAEDAVHAHRIDALLL